MPSLLVMCPHCGRPHEVDLHSERVLAGLTADIWRVLAFRYRGGEAINAAAIADSIPCGLSTVYYHLVKLERVGLVEMRTKHPAHRRKYWHVAAKQKPILKAS